MPSVNPAVGTGFNIQNTEKSCVKDDEILPPDLSILQRLGRCLVTSQHDPSMQVISAFVVISGVLICASGVGIGLGAGVALLGLFLFTHSTYEAASQLESEDRFLYIVACHAFLVITLLSPTGVAVAAMGAII